MMYRWLLLMVLLGHLSWALAQGMDAGNRPFEFPADAFAYPNELKWEYKLDPASGTMKAEPRSPPPSYALHCFVMARSARQFFLHARFAANEPKATRACYRHLVRLVLERSPRVRHEDEQRVVIPGYRNLHEFSQEQEALLKAESGGAWQCYCQRGNWRMVFPFTGRHQVRTAEDLKQRIEHNHFPIVHLVTFPSLALNHVLIVFGFGMEGHEIHFQVYDPNQPSETILLHFDLQHDRFLLPATRYFAGGPVHVYEIYKGTFY
jgi:hypothetical protein